MVADFIDKLRELAAQAPRQLEHIRTEEAAKTALVMPFIAALGYDVFNPAEVTPEYTADVGVKKGERVDYAIMQNGQAVILFECKPPSTDLDKVTPSQLYRYFSVSTARFGILTNGIRYLVYSDLDEPNKMDAKPYLELDFTNLNELAVEEIKRFSKPSFDIETILSTAQEYRYTREIRRILTAELREPSEEFIKLLASQVHTGRITQGIRERFSQFIKRAWHQLINDLITERLKSAMAVDTAASVAPKATATSETPVVPPVPDAAGEHSERLVQTTAEELEAFYIIKAVLRDAVDVRRVAIRDALSYCAVLLDDNNRRPICRLYFDSRKKVIGLFDAQKHEERISMESVDDIYQYADRLTSVVKAYN